MKSQQKIRIVSALLLVLLLATSLVACGNKGKTSDEKISVSIAYNEKFDNLSALVDSKLSGISLQYNAQISVTADYNTRRSIERGAGPDLVILSQYESEYNDDYMLPIEGYSFSSRYNNLKLREMMSDGKLYAVPLPSQFYGYVVNTTLLEREGFELPTNNEEMFEVLRHFRDKAALARSEGDSEIYVFSTYQYNYGIFGNLLCELMVPDFLSTKAGSDWLNNYLAKDELTTMAGVWNPALEFIESFFTEGLMDRSPFTKESNLPKCHLNMAEGDTIIGYGSSGDMVRTRELNAQCVAEGTAEEYEYSMLSIMGSEGSQGWAISTPQAYIGINKNVAADPKKLEACIKVLDLISTKEGQTAVMKDLRSESSYIDGVDSPVEIGGGIQNAIDNNCVYEISMPGRLLEYLGYNFDKFLGEEITIDEVFEAVDDYHFSGSADIEDMTVVGVLSDTLLYENLNTRRGETAIGNFVADSVRKLSGADIAVVNGGGIHGSLFKGVVTVGDLTAACPYSNQITLVEMTGEVMRLMFENSVTTIMESARPGGRFLQVSGVHYTFDLSKPVGQMIVALTLPDGTPIEDNKTYKVAINNYMAGNNGYVNGGDGYTMLNLFSDDIEKATGVTLIEGNMGTYAEALQHYFEASESEVTSVIEGRITNATPQ